MKKKLEQKHSNQPFFIEVPKPIKDMTKEEKDAFIDEIIEAIDGKRN